MKATRSRPSKASASPIICTHASGVRRARWLPVRLLHERADHERGGAAERAHRPRRRRHQERHGRQYLPLRRLHQHCCRRAPGAPGPGIAAETEDTMQTFHYAKAASIEKALAAADGAKFIAGGTTLVDLMKLNVENPSGLVDINLLPLDKIERLPNGGLRIGAMVRNS